MTTSLAGYQITDLIYKGTRTQVYRGLAIQDGRPVILKNLRKEYPTFEELLQFRHQYVITKNLEVAGIVKPITLEKEGNGYLLVMEDVGGISLLEYMGENPLNLEEFFPVAIALIEILDNLHKKRIIHKDIKPANILINPETKEIFLIDFSIASLLPKESQQLQNPNQLEGTLAYISPEQTGRMNRGIDYRSDFYGLGVTFYQLLAGKLPFESNDAMELVHSHIAKMPAALGNRELLTGNRGEEIPGVLSELVLKLMAKNAEDRYQSAKGIKHDLEVCWRQWQEKGSISAFELASRDLSDRFIIPEKLYGRETEVKTLLDAFERVGAGTTETILVAGFSGIGKTAVVNEVHKPIVEKRGYFIEGKFDQFNRNVPFSALVIALRDLMGQLLGETDVALEQWKQQILAALGEQAGVIIEVIPELENVIGPQPEVSELSASATQNRFNLLFGKFVRVFASKEHPLVIFLDDLQWADSASLKLIELLMHQGETPYLLLVGAYRDNEVYAGHPLMLALDEIGKTGARLHTITLSALSEKDINYLVADTLRCSLDVARPLAELVYQKAKGNPFFSNQFLKSLHEDGLIYFNVEANYWQCNIAKVKEAAIADDVVEFMAGRISKLPQKTQEVLKLAACIGNQFDLATLAIAYENSLAETVADLWKALEEELILPQSEIYKFFTAIDATPKEEENSTPISTYKFLHDRVQQAAYSLIQESQKQATHLKIGQLLLKGISATEKEEKLFDIVDRLNLGRTLLAGEKEKNELAELNLKATRKAKISTAYQAALEYASIGLNLLAVSSWETEYELTLNLHIEAVEVEYLNTNFQRAEQLSEVVIDRASDLLDRVKVYTLKIQFFIASNQLVKAIETALPVLEELGYPLHQTPEALKAIAPLPALEDLDKVPEMKDPHQLAALQLLAIITGPAYMGQPQILPYIVFKLVNLTLEYGHSASAGYAYGMYSLLLCGSLDDIELGYHSGLLSLELLEKFHAKEFACKIHLLFNMIRHWKEPAKNCLAFAETAQKGLEIGDIVYAGYGSMLLSAYLFFMGELLDEIETKQKYYAALMEKYKQDYSYYPIAIWRQLTLNLQGRAEDVLFLTGESFSEEQIEKLRGLDNRMLLFFLYLAKLILLYTMGDYGAAVQTADLAAGYEDAAPATMLVSGYRFYDSLARLGLYAEALPSQREQILERVTINQNKMRTWANSAPENYQHKYDLVEAEKVGCLGQNWEASELYDRAIAAAGKNGYVHEKALANELAAKFYLESGKEKIARCYIIDAYYGYAYWGALAKVEDLEKRYAKLLGPILNQGSNRISTDLTQTSRAATSVLESSSGISSLLDFASAIKASQAISQVLELEELLSKLMQAVMENAGASKGALLLPVRGALAIEALADYPPDAESIKISSVGRSLPLEKSRELPINLINTVRRTQKAIVLNNAAHDDRFIGDRYLKRSQPQSVLCTPLLNRGKLIAILYLENRLTTGAFTSDRLSLLDILTTQAAISLENARLYQQSQNYSFQLEQYLKQLQEAQLQLVQSEKMAAIGQLMAGVAHEINNPVGFIAGNLDYASEYIQSLKELLNLYQQGFDWNSETTQNKIEEIELDYLLEDFTALIESMKAGTNRIAEISKSMRTFSRSDTETKVYFNLQDGIDSTLLILKHRLKSNENLGEIEVVKNYSYLPPVQCYPGQLNQVFMNLIANAIDALEEANSGGSFGERKSHLNRITITTEIDAKKQNALVRIGDNGQGMSGKVKEKIFDHLFTTKEVGKGTGLGLSISRQIVEEKHGGTLTCTSEVGKGTEFAIALPL